MAMRLVGLALLFGTSAALAFDSTKVGQWGSLYLDDLSPVLAKSAQLKREVTAALARKNKKPEDILCFGMRFPGPWKNLGGMRVAPYTCDFRRQISSHRRHRSCHRPRWPDVRDNQRYGDETGDRRARGQSDVEMDDRRRSGKGPAVVGTVRADGAA
jgi:hypothetical protein